jgi:hypothetical protein
VAVVGLVGLLVALAVHLSVALVVQVRWAPTLIQLTGARVVVVEATLPVTLAPAVTVLLVL